MIDPGHAEDSYWEYPPNLNGLSSRELLALSEEAFCHYMTASRAFRETIYGVSAARAMAYPKPFGNGCALDFGCGAGYDAVSLAELGWFVHIVDLHSMNRRVASRWLNQLGFACGEVSDLKVFDQGQFSLVLSYGVLHHIENVEPVLQQLQEAVAPGGQLSLMLYTESFVPKLNERSDGKREGPYTRGYSFEEARELLGRDWAIRRTETWNQGKYRAYTAYRVEDSK